MKKVTIKIVTEKPVNIRVMPSKQSSAEKESIKISVEVIKEVNKKCGL